jgi:lipopolysaccharide transport system permease protein
MSVMAKAFDAYESRGLIKALAIRDLKLRYERSVLGFLWTILNPLVMIGVYTLVFSYILQSGIKHFPLFLVPVMLPWNFLIKCLLGVSPLLYQSGSLLNRAAFPSEALIFSGVLSTFVEFCLEMLIFTVILLVIGWPIVPALLIIPVVMLIHLLFTTGLVLALSVAQVFYRDTQYVVNLLTTAWFFLTPIFYSATFIPQKYQWFYYLNPMARMAVCFRDPLYSGQFPSWSMFGTAAMISVDVFIIGWLIFNKYRHQIPELI